MSNTRSSWGSKLSERTGKTSMQTSTLVDEAIKAASSAENESIVEREYKRTIEDINENAVQVQKEHKKMGRPKKYEEERTRISVYMSKSELDKIKEMAKIMNLTSSEYLVSAALKYMDEHIEEIAQYKRMQESFNILKKN